MVTERDSRATPLPLALSTATPSSCEPPEPAAKRRPACPLQLIATTGGPPRTCVGADVASIFTFLAMAGSALASLMVPWTVKSMTFDAPGPPASAPLSAARSEPVPELARFATTMVRAAGLAAAGLAAAGLAAAGLAGARAADA